MSSIFFQNNIWPSVPTSILPLNVFTISEHFKLVVLIGKNLQYNKCYELFTSFSCFLVLSVKTRKIGILNT